MSDDKELPPSEKKLKKALEENEDRPSEEVTSVVNGLVLGAIFFFAVPPLRDLIVPLLRLDPFALDQVETLRERASATLGALVAQAELAAGLLLAAALVSGLLANIANRRRPPGIKVPELSYNPIETIKETFGPSKVIATVRLWVICLIVIALTSYLCWLHLPDVVTGVYLSPTDLLPLALHLPWTILPVALVLVGFSAVIDAIQKQMEFVKNHRMDHEEVKRENKEDNGDPLIKSKRLELARGG